MRSAYRTLRSPLNYNSSPRRPSLGSAPAEHPSVPAAHRAGRRAQQPSRTGATSAPARRACPWRPRARWHAGVERGGAAAHAHAATHVAQTAPSPPGMAD